MTCGIYAIVCTKTWRSYVGQTFSTEKRIKQHFSTLKNGSHVNSELQSDFILYGKEYFIFEVLEETIESQLCNREEFWINFSENLYNNSNPVLELNLSNSDILRFWKSVNIHHDDCWRWEGSISNKGYGNFTITIDGKQKCLKSHRVSYFLTNPNHNQKSIIRHKCNNRNCCNPTHLELGSFRDNALDTLRTRNNRNILSLEYVKLLREYFQINPNILPKELSKWFTKQTGLKANHTSLISAAMNLSWVDSNYYPPKRTNRYYLTEDDKLLIMGYSRSGKNASEITCTMKLEHNIITSNRTVARLIRTIKGDLSSQPSDL